MSRADAANKEIGRHKRQVQRMFNAIAGRYVLLNHLLSGGGYLPASVLSQKSRPGRSLTDLWAGRYTPAVPPLLVLC